jgi:hypothetical protein
MLSDAALAQVPSVRLSVSAPGVDDSRCGGVVGLRGALLLFLTASARGGLEGFGLSLCDNELSGFGGESTGFLRVQEHFDVRRVIPIIL